MSKVEQPLLAAPNGANNGSAGRHGEGEDHKDHPDGLHAPPTATWQRVTAVIVANMLGTGVLSLPFAASVLGWVPFLAILCLVTAVALYSGDLLARLFAVVPEALVMADVARASHGRRGETFTRVVAYAYIAGVRRSSPRRAAPQPRLTPPPPPLPRSPSSSTSPPPKRCTTCCTTSGCARCTGRSPWGPWRWR